MSSRLESLTIQEDVKEGETEDEEGLPIHPYERLTTSSTDPATDIDVTKREVLFLTWYWLITRLYRCFSDIFPCSIHVDLPISHRVQGEVRDEKG